MLFRSKEYIGNILASKEKPDDLPVGYLITLIAKYYCCDTITADALSDITKKKLLEFDLDNYQEYRYHNKITAICEGLYSGKIEQGFQEREYIPVYESLLDFIRSLYNDRLK